MLSTLTYYQRNKKRISEKQRLYRVSHIEQYRERDRHNRINNKDKRREQEKLRKRRIRLEVLTHYGNSKLACVYCGFNNSDALTIDHINNDGAKQRCQTGWGSGSGTYYWLKKNNFPLGFQTLCANCQMIKEKLRRDRE